MGGRYKLAWRTQKDFMQNVEKAAKSSKGKLFVWRSKNKYSTTKPENYPKNWIEKLKLLNWLTKKLNNKPNKDFFSII